MTQIFYLVAVDDRPIDPPIPASLPPTSRSITLVRGIARKLYVRAYTAEQAAWRYFGWRVRQLHGTASL